MHHQDYVNYVAWRRARRIEWTDRQWDDAVTIFKAYWFLKCSVLSVMALIATPFVDSPLECFGFSLLCATGAALIAAWSLLGTPRSARIQREWNQHHVPSVNARMAVQEEDDATEEEHIAWFEEQDWVRLETGEWLHCERDLDLINARIAEDGRDVITKGFAGDGHPTAHPDYQPF